ncbi:MAG: DNA polymerase III subunit gamma/tau [Bacillota bacterium]|nr:DNA polymerase III subunit gamma/tau [Bacillota bacterium]
MAYKALYRKWRPEVFEEVIGQTQVIRTLKNQVKTDSISHAYLFSGIRGTGKTSTAKIFARAINCLNPNEGDPCNVCEICRGILSEQMMDVLEIDAASNNGVDHIREIRESVKYPPVKARYKVYIIDEVHMLSTGAFNALLKTLEEPPDHVVFILATTEIQKIPATVLSRCLRFTFKPLGLEEIRQRLLTICRSLDVNYEEAAVTTIALNGEGALRDALSILDQCLAYHPGELHYHQVTEVLGSINESLLFQLADHMGRQEALEAVRLVQSLYLEGKDLKQLVTDLMKHFRWLLMASLNATVEGWESLPEATREQYSEQSRLFKTRELSGIIRQLADTEFVMKRSAQPQLMLENNLISLCQTTQRTHPGESSAVNQLGVETWEALDERIGRIERFLARLSSRKTKQQPAKETPAAIETVSADESNGDALRDNRETPTAREAIPREATPEASPAKPPGLTERAASMPEETSAREKTVISEEPPQTSPEEPVAPAACGIGTSTPLTLETMKELWPHVLDQMRQDKKVSVQAMAREARLEKMDGCELTLAFLPEQAILCERLGREDIRNYLATLIQQKTGRRLRLQLQVSEASSEVEGKAGNIADRLRQMVPEDLLVIEEED